MMYRIVGLMGVALLLLVGCTEDSTNPASAETATTAGLLAGPGHGPHRLLSELDLTEEQHEQIKAIFESHKAEHEAIRAARRNGATREELQAEHEALRENIHAELESVLTAEQQARLEELRSELKEKGAGLHGRRGHNLSDAERTAMFDRRLERLTDALNLTPKQQKAIRELFTARQAERAALQGERPDREARQQAREEFHQQLEALLDADQIEKLNEIRPTDGRMHQRWGQSN